MERGVHEYLGVLGILFFRVPIICIVVVYSSNVKHSIGGTVSFQLSLVDSVPEK